MLLIQRRGQSEGRLLGSTVVQGEPAAEAVVGYGEVVEDSPRHERPGRQVGLVDVQSDEEDVREDVQHRHTGGAGGAVQALSRNNTNNLRGFSS